MTDHNLDNKIPIAPVAQDELPLKHMNRSQYESWVRKVEDPDWHEHRYHQNKQDRALVSFTRELKDTRAQLHQALAALARAERKEGEDNRSSVGGIVAFLVGQIAALGPNPAGEKTYGLMTLLHAALDSLVSPEAPEDGSEFALGTHHERDSF